MIPLPGKGSSCFLVRGIVEVARGGAHRYSRAKYYGWKSGSGDGEIIFVGDSPNDEPMFARFPLSCAVANINRYAALLKHFPSYATSKECGEGFAEIAEELLKKRRK